MSNYKQVIGAIYEAYANFFKRAMHPITKKNGKYFIEGFTKKGIEIHIYVTQKGKITTAYPKIRM